MELIIKQVLEKFNKKYTPITRFRIINNKDEKFINYTHVFTVYSGYGNFKFTTSRVFDFHSYLPIILMEIIKMQCVYYFNDNYKYTLYLILKNTFNKDLSQYIIRLMVCEDKKEINNKLIWYKKLCETYKNDIRKYRNLVDELFTMFDNITELTINL